jgi:hypothetical protein
MASRYFLGGFCRDGGGQPPADGAAAAGAGGESDEIELSLGLSLGGRFGRKTSLWKRSGARRRARARRGRVQFREKAVWKAKRPHPRYASAPPPPLPSPDPLRPSSIDPFWLPSPFQCRFSHRARRPARAPAAPPHPRTAHPCRPRPIPRSPHARRDASCFPRRGFGIPKATRAARRGRGPPGRRGGKRGGIPRLPSVGTGPAAVNVPACRCTRDATPPAALVGWAGLGRVSHWFFWPVAAYVCVRARARAGATAMPSQRPARHRLFFSGAVVSPFCLRLRVRQAVACVGVCARSFRSIRRAIPASSSADVVENQPLMTHPSFLRQHRLSGSSFRAEPFFDRGTEPRRRFLP